MPKTTQNPKVAGSNPAPATMNDEGVADREPVSPFRLPRLHPGSIPLRGYFRAAVSANAATGWEKRDVKGDVLHRRVSRRPPGHGVVTRSLRSCGSRRRASGSANIDLACDLDYHEVLSHLHRSRVVLSRRWYQILFARVGLNDV